MRPSQIGFERRLAQTEVALFLACARDADHGAVFDDKFANQVILGIGDQYVVVLIDA